MKTFIFSFLLAMATLSYALAQSASWHQSTAPETSSRYDDISFLNKDLGWAVDFDGSIWKTYDSGQNWQFLEGPGGSAYRCIAFLDSLNGFLGKLENDFQTDSGYFYKTSDGGITWQKVLDFPGPFLGGVCGMTTVNDSIAFAVGSYYGPASFYKTVDKGNSWSYVDLSTYMSGAVDVYFWSKDSGIVVGCYGDFSADSSGGIILSTWDGGATWDVRHQINIPNSLCWKISFSSHQIGYVSLEQLNFFDSVFYFLKTIDGGITWTDKIYHEGDYFNAEGIGFINDSLGWIGGGYFPFVTSDGGETWMTDSTLDSKMNRFRKISDSVAFCSGRFINRYSIQGYYTYVASAVINQPQVFVSPNPTSHQVKVLLRLFKPLNLSLNIYDLVGNCIYHQSAKDYNVGDTYLVLNLPSIRSGQYITVFSNESVTITQKLTVQ